MEDLTAVLQDINALLSDACDAMNANAWVLVEAARDAAREAIDAAEEDGPKQSAGTVVCRVGGVEVSRIQEGRAVVYAVSGTRVTFRALGHAVAFARHYL